MAKAPARDPFRCSECGWSTTKWVGRCGECQAWGSVEESGPLTPRKISLVPGVVAAPATPIGEISLAAAQSRSSGVAEEVMFEVGIDIANNQPKVLTTEAVQESDVVITMGCGDTCPFYPGKRYKDWVLEDPAGKEIEIVRQIRDQIKLRVENLLAEII